MRERTTREIVESWRACIERAMQLGDADAAYRLARVFVRRCRELRLVPDDDERARV
jgi:hypothetical protein